MIDWVESGTVVGWKIWYTDESCASSKEMSWEKAPDQDIQCVFLYVDRWYNIGSTAYPGRVALGGVDYYFYNPRLDKFGTEFDDKSLVPDDSVIKYGKYTEWDTYIKVQNRAYKDLNI